MKQAIDTPNAINEKICLISYATSCRKFKGKKKQRQEYWQLKQQIEYDVKQCLKRAFFLRWVREMISQVQLKEAKVRDNLLS